MRRKLPPPAYLQLCDSRKGAATLPPTTAPSVLMSDVVPAQTRQLRPICRIKEVFGFGGIAPPLQERQSPCFEKPLMYFSGKLERCRSQEISLVEPCCVLSALREPSLSIERSHQERKIQGRKRGGAEASAYPLVRGQRRRSNIGCSSCTGTASSSKRDEKNHPG